MTNCPVMRVSAVCGVCLPLFAIAACEHSSEDASVQREMQTASSKGPNALTTTSRQEEHPLGEGNHPTAGGDQKEPATWHLQLPPMLEIGTLHADTSTDFGTVVGGARFSDGSIVIADAESRQLRYFDASGRFLLAVGREGGGPGEFRQLGSAKRCAGRSTHCASLR